MENEYFSRNLEEQGDRQVLTFERRRLRRESILLQICILCSRAAVSGGFAVSLVLYLIISIFIGRLSIKFVTNIARYHVAKCCIKK